MSRLPLEPTPEMIAAGADVLEYVNGIGRWLAEDLSRSVLERALAVRRESTTLPPRDGCTCHSGDHPHTFNPPVFVGCAGCAPRHS